MDFTRIAISSKLPGFLVQAGLWGIHKCKENIKTHHSLNFHKNLHFLFCQCEYRHDDFCTMSVHLEELEKYSEISPSYFFAKKKEALNFWVLRSDS